MGKSQRDSPLQALPSHCPSQAVVDVSENLRAKLYAIFCKIGFTDLPGVAVDDHVTLTIIERYLDFKVIPSPMFGRDMSAGLLITLNLAICAFASIE